MVAAMIVPSLPRPGRRHSVFQPPRGRRRGAALLFFLAASPALAQAPLLPSSGYPGGASPPGSQPPAPASPQSGPIRTSAPAPAPATPDAPPDEATSASPWSGAIELGASQSTGNTEEQDLSTRLSLTYDKKRWRHQGLVEFFLSTEDNDLTENELTVRLETDYRLTERFFGFAAVEYEDDRFSGFDYRVTANPGIGYAVILPKPVSWELRAGPGYRFSKVAGTGKTETEVIGRAESTFKWDITPTATFTNRLEAVTGEERTTSTAETALSTRINQALRLKLSFKADHDSNVPAGTEKLDTKTIVSVAYEF